MWKLIEWNGKNVGMPYFSVHILVCLYVKTEKCCTVFLDNVHDVFGKLYFSISAIYVYLRA